ncbi:MAG: hypothetical protein AAFY71_10985 [Bacteroidota bacterium]
MSWFKRKKQEKADPHTPKWVDLDGHPLQEGDEVEALRYGMGTCTIISDENGLAYQSIESGKIVSCWYMVDATTKHQKVRKIL